MKSRIRCALLTIRLETREAIIGRCRRLLDEYPSSQWAKLAKDGF